MQGVDLGSQHSDYGPMDVSTGPLDFDALEEVPSPPQDSQVAAAWYDTDLWPSTHPPTMFLQSAAFLLCFYCRFSSLCRLILLLKILLFGFFVKYGSQTFLNLLWLVTWEW